MPIAPVQAPLKISSDTSGSKKRLSPYRKLLDDPDFKRWIDNVERGSVSYAYECLRRMGYVQKRFGKGPSLRILAMTTHPIDLRT